MTTLRRWLPRAVRILPRLTAPLLALSVACTLALGTGSALAGTRSHAHRTGATALAPSSFVETGSRASKKHRAHPGTAAATGSRPRSSKASRAAEVRGRQAKPGKTRHGRSRLPEPVAEPIPMSRASRNAGRGTRETARMKRGRRGSHSEQDFAVAEVNSRSANGDYVARLHTHSRGVHGRYGSRASEDRGPVIVASASQPSRSSAAWNHTPSSRQAYASRSSMNGASGASPRDYTAPAYAEGISHPEDAAPMAREQASLGRATIGTAEVIAAPPAHAQAYTPANGSSPQVVQGFGSEVALASPDPGATRRRNHPIPASELPGMAPAPSLEERDAITYAAVSPAVLPQIYDRDGRLLMPAPLKGSHEVLVHQNTMANSDGLERIADDGELDRLRADHELVGFPVSAELRVNEDLPMNRRYARPWTVLFAADIAHAFFDRFHQPLQVNSAVRTVSYQARLQRVNGNAAATDGDAASPHLTGQAIDFGKRGMSAAEIAWMRAYLLPLMSAGRIDVEEEFQQACFHISVYRRYAAGRPAHEFAQVRPAGVRSQDAANPSSQDIP